MIDERLSRRLMVVDEPVIPDRDFADQLFDILAVELGIEDTMPGARVGRPRVGLRGAKVRERGTRLELLYVAALLVVAAIIAVAVGVGAFRPTVPNQPADLLSRVRAAGTLRAVVPA